MAADIDIINAALSKLGEFTLTARTDPSPQGRLANRTYDDLRDALLRQFPWNFATKRISLSASATAPDWGYTLQYNLPSDFLRLIEINNASDTDWRLEGGAILTDIEAPLQILYVRQVTEQEMDPTFRDALAARLAAEWAEPLSQTSTVVQQMTAMYVNKLQVARMADGQEDRERVVSATAFTDARY